MRNPFLLTLIALTMMAAACSVMTTPPAPSTALPTVAAPTSTTLPSIAVPPSPTPTPAYLAKLGTVEHDVTYCVSDGIALTLDVYYPQVMPKPAPVAVYVHGGSWSAGDKKEGMGMTDVPELLARGYLVVSVDYRHSPVWQFPAQLEDVKCAIRFLRANAGRFNLNPKQIGAWGHSAGGHLVSLLGTTDVGAGFEGPDNYLDQSSRVQAVADLCGRANLRGMPEDKAQSVFGVTGNSAHLLEHASPITFVTSDDPPFLILHGEKDTVVPPKVSREFADRLYMAGVPVKLVFVRNADHTFQPVEGAMSPTRAEMTQLIADFFDQYLKN